MRNSIIENSLMTNCIDWLKIVFLELDGDTKLARAVDVMME